MVDIPDRLTREFLIKNREYDIGSPFHHWRAFPWRQVVLLEVSGIWELEDCPYYMREIWDIVCERLRHHERVYLLINANNMNIQSEEFRRYLKESWGHLLDRDDLQICLIEEKAMKRAIWSSIYRLLGKRDRIKIFAGYEPAFAWLSRRLRTEMEPPMTDRIGEFLIRIGAMTPDQVQAVLGAQATGDVRRFGEIALELGLVRDDAIKRYVDYLEKQRVKE